MSHAFACIVAYICLTKASLFSLVTKALRDTDGPLVFSNLWRQRTPSRKTAATTFFHLLGEWLSEDSLCFICCQLKHRPQLFHTSKKQKAIIFNDKTQIHIDVVLTKIWRHKSVKTRITRLKFGALTLGARVRYSLGSNENTTFFEYPRQNPGMAGSLCTRFFHWFRGSFTHNQLFRIPITPFYAAFAKTASADGAKWTKANLGTQSVDKCKAPFCTRSRSHECRCERSLIGAVFFIKRNFCNLIGLEQWYFSLIWNTNMWKLQTVCGY